MAFLQVAIALVIIAVIAAIVKTYVRIPANLAPVVDVVLGLLFAGIVLWVINTYVPMADTIKAILNIVVVVAACIWVLQTVGLWGEVVRIWNRVTKHTPTTGV